MAKNYSISELVAPTNCTANPISGGSLTASTTYYYRAVIANHGPGAFYSTEATRSIPSTEFSMTTTATNKTGQIYFDNNVPLPSADYGHVFIYRTKVSGDYLQTNATGTWQKHIVPLGSSSYAYAICLSNIHKVYTFTTAANVAVLVPGETITEQVSGATAIVVSDPAGGNTFKVRSITGTWDGLNNFDGSITGNDLGAWSSTSAQVGYCVLDTYADSGLKYLPFFHEGLPTIHITGGTDADPITPQNIYDWLVAQGKTYCIDIVPVFGQATGDWVNSAGNEIGQYFQWRFNLMELTNTEVHLAITNNVVVYHLAGKLYLTGNGNFRMGKIKTTAGMNKQRTYDGGVYIANKSYAYYSGFTSTANFYIYDSYFSGKVDPYTNNSWCNRDGYFQCTQSGDAKIYDSIYRSTGRFSALYDIVSSRMQIPNCEISSLNPDATISYGVFDTYLRHYYPYADNVYPDVIFVQNYSYSVYMYANYVGTHKTIFQHFISPTWERDDPQIYRRVHTNSEPADVFVMESFTFDLTVLDDDNNPIDGATVTLKDAQGNSQLLTKTTTYTAGSQYNKTDTSITTGGAAPSVGSKYRIGMERISVDSGSNPYTVTRAVDNTTANYFGVGNQKLYFWLVNPSLDTNASGQLTQTFPMARYWYEYDAAAGSGVNITDTEQSFNPFILTISKPGYLTYKKKFTLNKKINWIISLKHSPYKEILGLK